MAICKTTVLKCLLLQLSMWFLFEGHICQHALSHLLVNNSDFWFPKVPMSRSHLSNPSRRRRPPGGSGKRSSNYSHTHHWEGKQGKAIDVGNVCTNSNTFSFVRTSFLPCVCVLVAQALQHRGEIVFMSQRFLVNPHWVITHGEASFVAACVYTRVFVLDIMSLLDVAVWSSSAVCKNTHKTRGLQSRQNAHNAARKQESQTNELWRPKLKLIFSCMSAC